MKKLLGKLLGPALGWILPFWGQVKAARAWLTLVAVASAAAFLYYSFATVGRDRDQLDSFARIACSSAGIAFDPSDELAVDAKGKQRVVHHKRGELCAARILALSNFERDATKASNEALAGALQDHRFKSEADASAAARDAAAAAAAARKMEASENAIQGDKVGSDWFDALNGLGRLRAPGH